MTDKTNCRDIQEQLPLLFIGDLRPDQERVVKDHLKACSSCREVYHAELALFEKAAESHPVELWAHPTADLLEAYVSDRAGMNPGDRAKVETHLAACKLCRETVEKTETLPDRLDDLIPAGTLVVTEGMSDKASNVTSLPESRSATSFKRWRVPATWVAAAALLVLVVSQLVNKSVEPVAVVEGQFSAVLRSASEPMVFESPTSNFEFQASVYVGPEESHDYNLLLISRENDSVFFSQASLRTYDSLGSAHFQVNLIPGEYLLVIEDIVPGDTIRIEHPFEIRQQ